MGNYWGHPKSGESSIEGIITEVKEELGISINKPILFKQASGKNSFCDLYYLKTNINIEDIKIQKDEVSDIKWATVDEIKILYQNQLFNKGHYMMFQDCLEFLNKK